MKKIMCLLSILFIGITSNDVYAVSSVKKTGTPLITNVKTVAVTPKKQPEIKANNSRIGKTTKTGTVKPTSQTTSASDKTRFPAITVFGMPKNGKTSVLVNNIDQPVKNVNVPEESSGSAVTEVVESGSGNYVTDIEANGNKLNVTKTMLLYAPVRNGSDETIRGNAEIWVIR